MFKFIRKLYNLIKSSDEQCHVHLHITCDSVHIESDNINGLKVSEERSEISPKTARHKEIFETSESSEPREDLFAEISGGFSTPAVGFGEEIRRSSSGDEDDSA